MLTYAIFLAVLLGGALLIESSSVKNPQKSQLIFAGIVIVLFWGSVDARDFGTDIMNYYNNAVKAGGLSYSAYLDRSKFEDGYATFVWLVAHIFKNPQALLFVQNAFVTFSVFRFIYRNSKDVFLSIVTYVCIGSFGMFSYAFRQAFAIAICLFALEAIQKKKNLLAILLILFATLFHQTALVFLPVIFLSGRKLNSKNIFFFSVFMLIIAFSLDRILPSANELFDMEYGDGGAPSVIGGLINIAVYIIAFILLANKYKATFDFKEKEMDKLSIIVFLSIIGFVLYVCRFSALAMERVAYYFLPAFCIIFAEGLTTFENKRIKDMPVLFVLLSVALFLYRSNTSLGIYSCIWW